MAGDTELGLTWRAGGGPDAAGSGCRGEALTDDAPAESSPSPDPVRSAGRWAAYLALVLG